MYSTNEQQIAAVESFIKKIPESIVKGQYENWLRDVKKDNRISSEEMEKFVSLSNALPVELQNFPQTFSHTVKNYKETEVTEAKGGIKNKANLTGELNKSIHDVPEPVREGAKLHSDKEAVAKTVVVGKGKK